ncbi:MAG: hypothetical protein RR912_06265 [Clostridium sp.]
MVELKANSKLNNSGVINTIDSPQLRVKAGNTSKIKIEDGATINMLNGSELKFNSKEDILAGRDSLRIYEGANIFIKDKKYIGKNGLVNITANNGDINQPVGSWSYNGDGMIMLCVNGESLRNKADFYKFKDNINRIPWSVLSWEWEKK